MEGKSIPTSYVLDCRKLDSSATTHYYYSVIANPELIKITDEGDKKITTYFDAHFNIEKVILAQHGNGCWVPIKIAQFFEFPPIKIGQLME